MNNDETSAKNDRQTGAQNVTSQAETEPAVEPGPRKLNGKRKRIAFVVLVVLIAGAVGLWYHYSQIASTDDAEIEGYLHPISARVPGYVTKVTVDDTQYVEKGTVLVQLDPTDYQVAVELAKAHLAQAQAQASAAMGGVPITSVSTQSHVNSAEADVQGAQAGILAAEKQFQQAEARLTQTEANNVKIQDDLERYRQLIGKREISQQQYDEAVAASKSSAAAVTEAQAGVAAADQQVTQARSRMQDAQAELRSAHTRPEQMQVTRANAQAAAAAVEEAEAQLHRAELDLQYTTIVAPADGIVGKRTAVAGQNVAPGQTLMTIVPTREIWVTANFKETELRGMRPGQSVRIHVDSTDRDYTGKIQGIAGATGVQFSLLPPENATGNYVKVVQRVPVRIVFDPGQDPNHQLQVGLSVEPSVRLH
ncbi:MAG: HlyD family efflux transporter periplasmic adaptor subunit [Acidobacteriota bacterium]